MNHLRTILFGTAFVLFPPRRSYVKPSIADILLDLKLIEAVLDTLDAVGVLDYDETRKVMNAKQQIWNVQNVATSLQNGDENSYLEAMKRLDTQVAF